MCLTIAGSDPSGGAGIQGDLKTFTALGAYGMAVLTALTAQNTCEVRGIHEVPPEFVASQIATVLDDLPCHAAKTGMLASAAIVQAVVSELRRHPQLPLIVDPVMVSTSGARLLDEMAVDAVRRELLPLATIVTPNAPEAEVLAGITIRTPEDAERAARLIYEFGPQSVLVKGGDFAPQSSQVTDLLFDGTTVTRWTSPRIPTRHCHGSGCALAAALCVHLAQKSDLLPAVESARQFVQNAIRYALPIGSGNGPVNHLQGNVQASPP